VAGGCGDVDGVWSTVQAKFDDPDVPAGHLARVVAASAGASAVVEGGASAVAVAGDVVNVPDGCLTVRIPASLVAQLDQLGEPAIEQNGGSGPHPQEGQGLRSGFVVR
jgi:hypothetical protein